MIQTLAGVVLWALFSLVIAGTMLAVIAVNIPVLILSRLFDRQAFSHVVQSCRVICTGKPTGTR